MPNREGFLMVGLAVFFGSLTVLTLHAVLTKPNPKATPSASFAEEKLKSDFATLKAKPNILIFIADDMGYEDLASYGHPSVPRNFIDELAETGIRFQSFYAADSLCTPARAGLLTGRLPIRNGVVGTPGQPRVFQPWSTGGLPLEETTMPELLKTVGYTTGMVGKWHIGMNKDTATDGTYLPPNHGFDFVGLNMPMSNGWQCDESKYWNPVGPDPAQCFLYNGSQIVQQPVNFTGLTDSLVQDFDRFLDRKGPEPFFFYFSFFQPHDALFSWKSGYDKKSKTGLYYGDILEMAEGMRQSVDSLKQRGMLEETLIIFMSDHGPHLELCTRGGRTPFKGGKSTSFEGGFRIPLILSWPDVVPSGISRSVLSTLDLLPTFAALTDAVSDVHMDGTDRRAYLFNASSTLLHRPIFYYCNQILMAARFGRYKFHWRTTHPPTADDLTLNCPNGLPLRDFYVDDPVVCTLNSTTSRDPPLVYDVLQDPGERWPLDYEQLSEKLKTDVQDLVARHQDSLTDKRDPQLGPQNMKVVPCCDPPKCSCNYDGPFVPVQQKLG